MKESFFLVACLCVSVTVSCEIVTCSLRRYCFRQKPDVKKHLLNSSLFLDWYDREKWFALLVLVVTAGVRLANTGGLRKEHI